MKGIIEFNKFSRRRYIISPRFQLRYIGIMLGTVLSTGLFIGGCVYFIVMAVINKNLPFLDRRQLFADMVFSQANQVFLIGLPAVLLTVVILSVYISHKISGPEYRIKKILDSMSRGDFAVPVKLRKGDELRVLADKLEDVNQNISYMFKEQKEMVNSLCSTTKSLVKEVKKVRSSRIKMLALTRALSETSSKLKENLKSVKIIDV